MKRYDLSKIMKSAWRTYKYSGKKNGKTFGECLASSWRLEKLAVSMEESEQKRAAKAKEAAIRINAEIAEWKVKQEAKRAEETAKEERAAKEMGMSFDEYQNYLSRAMGYGVGRYCGD
ncbi:MAG: hypothetical protein UD103_07930 [Bacteroidales bacterium]|nr:hypothetical protein [Bacteroidales bacterium]